MGKELLNLSDGTMVGKVCGVVLTPDCKVAGLKVRERKLMSGTITVAFENIKSFGATITLHGVSNVMAQETRTVLGKNVITADGNLLGRVEELAFDMETGIVEEVVIQGELMDTMLGGRGILPGDKLLNFGKDVVIAVDNICSQGKAMYSSNCKSFAENYEQTKIYRDYINLYTSILSMY